MEQSPFCEANSSSATQEIPLLYGTRTFIIVFIRTSWIQLTSKHPHLFKINFNLSSNLQKKIRQVFFSLHAFLIKLCINILSSFACYICRLSHPPWFYRPNNQIPSVTAYIMLGFYGKVGVGHLPHLQSGGPSLVGSLWLLFQYIQSYLPYLLSVEPEWTPRCTLVLIARRISRSEFSK
jgi:hypothetical protein